MAEMTKKTRIETYILGALMVVLAIALYANRSGEAAIAGLQIGDVQFRALGVTDPSLRLDLLGRLRQEEYKGVHRNIFSAALLPRPPRAATVVPAAQQPVPPPVLAGPAPLVVPATFFGIVTDISTGKRKAVFSGSENDVYIVSEGGILFGQYRVEKIGNNSVDLEEVASGRKTTLTLAPPADNSQPSQAQL